MNGKLVGISHLVDAFDHKNVETVTAVTHNHEIDNALVARVAYIGHPSLRNQGKILSPHVLYQLTQLGIAAVIMEAGQSGLYVVAVKETPCFLGVLRSNEGCFAQYAKRPEGDVFHVPYGSSDQVKQGILRYICQH